jgi:uncharacterized membrane protein (UPF0127 family)
MNFTFIHIAQILLALSSPAAAALEECPGDQLAVRDMISGEAAGFTVAVVDTPGALARGLMMVEHMPENAGMLFVFPQTREVSFWMKDTLIPLDMLFIDDAGYVASIHEGAIPHDTTSIPSGSPVRYVLEINGGVVEKLGLAPGDKVINPALGTGCVDIRNEELRYDEDD